MASGEKWDRKNVVNQTMKENKGSLECLSLSFSVFNRREKNRLYHNKGRWKCKKSHF